MKNFLLLISFCLTHICLGQNQGYSDLLDNYHMQKQFNGVALVATNGEIDFLGSEGVGNRQQKTGLNVKSKFKIASISKVFTAVLVMKLVEEGKLHLDDKISKYLSNYTGEGKDHVTIHHLLTYSSGIENQLAAQGISPYQLQISLD